MKLNLRMLALASFVLIASGIAHGQQISPTAEEFKGPHAKGFFTVANQGVKPLAVSVEATSLSIDSNGHPVLSPNPPNVTVIFKQPQFKLGPKQTHMVNFEATCISVPCHFELLASFAPAIDSDGIAVVTHLGTAIYVCEKQRDCRKETLATLNYPTQAGK